MTKTLIAVGSVAAALAMVVSMAGTAQAAPGGRSGGISALVTAGNITVAQKDAFKAAVDLEKETAGVTCAEAKAAALASLVSKGTITQSQADAIKAAKAAKKASTTTTPATPAS